jgi:thiol-disulfide isomerase/thioredoxin
MKGHVVLIDFWAMHCPGCVADMPKLKKAYDRFHDQGFEIIGINNDDDGKKLRTYLKKEKIPWPQSFESTPNVDNAIFQQFGVYGIPHMMLLDKRGVLRNDVVRVDDDFEAKISRLMAEE